MRFIKQTNKQRKETRLVSNKFEDMLKSLNITIWLTFQSFFYFFLENMIKLMDIVENSFYELVFFFFFLSRCAVYFPGKKHWLLCRKLHSLNVFMPSLRIRWWIWTHVVMNLSGFRISKKSQCPSPRPDMPTNIMMFIELRKAEINYPWFDNLFLLLTSAK
jgi:hypothetical protein